MSSDTEHGKAKCMCDTWQAMCPHAFQWTCLKMGVHNQFIEERAGKEKRKGGKEIQGKEKRKREKEENKEKGKERENEEGGRRFLPQFIGILTVGTHWTKE